MALTVVKTTALSGTITNAQLAGSIDLTAKVTGTLPIANGGTNSTSTTFVNAATNVTGTLATGNGGTGSTATAFVNVASNVTGTLPVANGGTALSSGFINGVANVGKIGQVVQGIASSTVTVNSETYTQVGPSVSITPSATSSKVLCMFFGGMVQEGQLQKSGVMQIYRDASGLGNIQGHLGYSYTSASYNAKTEYSWPSITAIDSPSSTSSLTYTVKAKMSQGSSYHVWNYDLQNGTRSYMILMEILA